MAGTKSMRYNPKTKKELDLTDHKLTELINDRFTTAVDYRYYRFLKNWFRYNDNMGQELYRMEMMIIVQMKDRAISMKDPVCEISFL